MLILKQTVLINIVTIIRLYCRLKCEAKLPDCATSVIFRYSFHIRMSKFCK